MGYTMYRVGEPTTWLVGLPLEVFYWYMLVYAWLEGVGQVYDKPFILRIQLKFNFILYEIRSS